MDDAQCVALLQWAAPRLNLRWPGFRRVRQQVCKRVRRRLRALGLADAAAYRARLEADPAEWATLDALCRVTVSRFYRDRAVFDCLRTRLLPALVRAAQAQGEPCLRLWSAGCASGEEPYTLALVLTLGLPGAGPALPFDILATDADEALLARARRACYPRGTLRELPPAWVERAFVAAGDEHCLRPGARAGVRFACEDLRARMPPGPFHVLLCRNLAFTYFAPSLQEEVLARLVERLAPGGVLGLGAHEALPVPPSTHGLVPVGPGLPLWCRA